MDAKEIKLREELDSIDESMTLKRREIESLKVKKEELREELYKYIRNNVKIVPYCSFEEEDPAITLLNMLNDKDEMELDDIAYILGITVSTLKARIDSTKIKKYRRYDSRGTIMSRLEVGYIKSILDMKKSNPKMRECLKYILEFHNTANIPLSISTPLKDMASPIGEYIKYKNMSVCDLIAQGFGRGLITFPQYNTVVRMLESYNFGYRLVWMRSSYRNYTSYTVKKDDNGMSVKIYINKEK